jgi:hypothetical protein
MSRVEQEISELRGSGQLKTRGKRRGKRLRSTISSRQHTSRTRPNQRNEQMSRVIPVDDNIGNLASIEVESINFKSKSLKRSESILDSNLVSSFCPTLLLQFLVKNETLSLDHEFLSGASLIADISGFVKLCGELSKGGAEGFDDLQICTRTFIGELVKIVYHYGGDGRKLHIYLT